MCFFKQQNRGVDRWRDSCEGSRTSLAIFRSRYRQLLPGTQHNKVTSIDTITQSDDDAAWNKSLIELHFYLKLTNVTTNSFLAPVLGTIFQWNYAAVTVHWLRSQASRKNWKRSYSLECLRDNSDMNIHHIILYSSVLFYYSCTLWFDYFPFLLVWLPPCSGTCLEGTLIFVILLIISRDVFCPYRLLD